MRNIILYEINDIIITSAKFITGQHLGVYGHVS